MTIRDRLALFLLAVILLILALHLLALDQFLYWRFWWYDLVMHFLGGFWLAITSLWLIYFSGYAKDYQPKINRVLLIVLGSVIIFGILWEIFEYVSGATYNGESYALDTALDLLLDVLGGCFGYLISLKFVRRFGLVNESQNYEK